MSASARCADARDTRPSAPGISSFRSTALAASVLALALTATPAQAQTVFHACYVPASGTVYRIKAPNTPANCLQPTHVAFSWTDGAGGGAPGGGVSDHGALTGLGDDDHQQYLIANGVRTAGGFAVSTLADGAPQAPLVTNTGNNRPTLMWAGGYGALRSGFNTNGGWTAAKLGAASASFGDNNEASGWASFSATSEAKATGYYSVAMGVQAEATGASAVALGGWAKASAYAAMALQGGLASGQNSLAWVGTASGDQAVAFGGNATGMSAYAWGNTAKASGTESMAFRGTASGNNATALRGIASGENSVAIGSNANTNNQTNAIVISAELTAGQSKALTQGQIVLQGSRLYFGRAAQASLGADRFIETSTGAYLSNGGTWTNTSDSTQKTGFRAVDGEQILGKLATLPVYTWQYLAEDSTTRHMGPTAQAFRAAFNLGDTDKAISTVDIDGVAIAGVKALEARTKALKAETLALREHNAELTSRLAQLETLVAQLAAQLATPSATSSTNQTSTETSGR